MKFKLLLSSIPIVIYLLLSYTGAYANGLIDTGQTYSYDVMKSDIERIKNTYGEIVEFESLGKTKYNRDIWAIKLGKGEATIFINGSHHAREWMTSLLIMDMVDEYAFAYQNDLFIDGYNTKELLSKVTIWFVPMVNPDGVTLQQKGLNAFPLEVRESLLSMNQGSPDFKRWKANADGVDLNRQYPADWENIKYVRYYPSWKNYKGKTPLETIENKIMKDFTYRIDPEIATSYHSSGRVLYWHFNTLEKNFNRDEILAKKLSSMTGYEMVKPVTSPSGGGYSDWFIQEFNRPGFTPEISYYVGDTHVPLSVYPEVWKRNKSVGLWMAEEGYKLWEAEELNRLIGVSQWYKKDGQLTNALYYALEASKINALNQKVSTYLWDTSKFVADVAYDAFHRHDDITSEKLYKKLFESEGVPDIFKNDAKINVAYVYEGRAKWYYSKGNLYNAIHFLGLAKEYGNTNEIISELITNASNELFEEAAKVGNFNYYKLLRDTTGVPRGIKDAAIEKLN